MLYVKRAIVQEPGKIHDFDSKRTFATCPVVKEADRSVVLFVALTVPGGVSGVHVNSV